MKLVNKLFKIGCFSTGIAAGLGALGCRGEAKPGAERKPAAAAAAAAASETAPSAEPVSGASPQASASAEQPAPSIETGLAAVTAEQLLAGIRAQAKKATLVSTWATWCGPCRRELPMLQALSTNYRPQGIEIVLVSVDEAKDAEKARSYLKDSGISLTSYIVSGSMEDFKQGINPRWPGMLPASFLFDAKAELKHFWGGEAFEEEITSIVDAFAAGRPIRSETRYGLAPGKTE